MNRSILALLVTLACAITALSQRTENRESAQGSADSSTSVTKVGKNLEIKSGTHLTGELQNTIDVRRAKVGDQVVLKTTRAIKSGGQVVVSKGAKLIGHVTEVTQKTKGSAGSSIGLIFDRMEHGALTFPISATISSITAANANVRSNDNDLFASDASMSSSSTARSSAPAGSGGGLLGGVTNTAGAVVNTTAATAGNITSAAGSTVNATTNAIGTTASGIGKSLGRIQISESTSTSAKGGALLSLEGDNIKLEKGTNFNLVLNQSARAGITKEQ